MSRVGLWPGLLVGLWASVSSAQPPPRDSTNTANKKGTAIIRGRVLAGDTGRPLRRVRITASAPELSGPSRNTSTDADGRYELTELPSGRYTLRVARGGYLPLAYGQGRPREAGKPVVVNDHQEIDHIDFVLPRMSVISGRVLDEAGDPIEGVSVYAARSMFRDGRRQIVLTGQPQNRTDDAGFYRLRGLPPGTYYVLATTKETWTVNRDRARQVMGYTPTYFPGTTNVNEARRVTVRVGEEAGNNDLALIPGHAARVSGTAFDSHGQPFQTVVLQEETRGEEFGSFGTVATASVNRDGTFSIENVPPGEYVIGASRRRETGDPQVALSDVKVDGVDIDNVSLTGSAGGTVSGRVRTEDGSVPDVPQLRVSIREPLAGQPSPMILGAIGFPASEVKADGTFSVDGVFGRARLTLTLPDAWVMKEVLHDGRDITDSPFELRSGETRSDVQVIITNKVTSVSGHLADDKAAPITDATIIVFSNDATKWSQGNRFVKAARPDQQGRWQVKGLPPGEFVAVAVDYVEDGEWNDPDYLESIRRLGAKVALDEGASQEIPLKLAKP
jgi:hypothetical protein